MRAPADAQTRVEALRLVAEGCSAREAARRIGFSNRTVSTWASLAGMELKTGTWTGGLARPWPPPEPLEPPGRLVVSQRVLIGVRLGDGWSLRAIARALGVAPSTVSREVARGHRHGHYDPGWSQRQAGQQRRRPRPGKLAAGTELRCRVVAGLNQRHSPQQIAHRLRRDFPDREDLRVSHETIYQALYVQGRGTLREELRTVKALRSGRVHRKPRSALPTRVGKPWLTGAHVSQRAAEAADRAVPGHWEGDLVIGRGGRSALITLVERATRFCLIRRLPDLRTSPLVVEQLTTMAQALPAELWESLTWDQGSEMAHHHRFTVATHCPVYFCDPHSPWQRGSNENTNGLIRDFHPKGTDFATLTDADIAHTQHLLNTRPRQTLDWQTPAERLDQLMSVALTT